MKNELYESLTEHIAEHGFKCIDGVTTHNSPVDNIHAVISHLYSPERYFIFLYGKSFLIRKYDDNLETRESRRVVSSI